MKPLKFNLVDEGLFFYEENEERWAIRHPTKSYSKNKSGMYEMYIEIAGNRVNPKFIGYSKTFKKAKEQITEFVQLNMNYNSFDNYFYL